MDQLPKCLGHNRMLDFKVVEELAEWEDPCRLLAFALACERRSDFIKHGARAELASWIEAALRTLNATERAGALNETVVRNRCLEAFGDLKLDSFPKPHLEIAWREPEHNPAGQLVAESYLRWGRHREKIPTEQWDSALVIRGGPQGYRRGRSTGQFGPVPYDRMDIFVTEDELHEPWEYPADYNRDAERPMVFPWPTILRLIEPRYSGSVQSPPAKLTRQGLACRLNEADGFVSAVQALGAFFAAVVREGDEAIVQSVAHAVRQAVVHARLGIWLRTAHPLAAVEECLTRLDGTIINDIPRLVHEMKRCSNRGSAWRDLAVLYDDPDWPPFRFSDQDDPAPDIRRNNMGL